LDKLSDETSKFRRFLFPFQAEQARKNKQEQGCTMTKEVFARNFLAAKSEPGISLSSASAKQKYYK
jgi:hypothetical protein